MDFIRLPLVQSSIQWHRWRSDGIGGSDAAILMGWDRYKSVDSLFREKCGEHDRLQPTAAMLSGSANEAEALARFVKRTKLTSMAPGCLQHKNYRWLRCSVDGIDVNNSYIVEIKCGQSNYYNSIGKRSIPPWNMPQLQHTMAVTGALALYYWAWIPGERGLLRQIKRNERYIDKLMDVEQKFWFRVTAHRRKTNKT